MGVGFGCGGFHGMYSYVTVLDSSHVVAVIYYVPGDEIRGHRTALGPEMQGACTLLTVYKDTRASPEGGHWLGDLLRAHGRQPGHQPSNPTATGTVTMKQTELAGEMWPVLWCRSAPPHPARNLSTAEPGGGSFMSQ